MHRITDASVDLNVLGGQGGLPLHQRFEHFRRAWLPSRSSTGGDAQYSQRLSSEHYRIARSLLRVHGPAASDQYDFVHLVRYFENKLIFRKRLPESATDQFDERSLRLWHPRCVRLHGNSRAHHRSLPQLGGTRASSELAPA